MYLFIMKYNHSRIRHKYWYSNGFKVNNSGHLNKYLGLEVNFRSRFSGESMYVECSS